MKGETSKDGKISGNVQLVRGHNTHHSGGGMKHGDPESRGDGMDGDTNDHSEIQDVTAEHGPAHHHAITDNQDGTFSSQTHHADGHVHEKQGHKSLKEAHEHGEHAMEATAPEESPEQAMSGGEKPMGMGKVSHSGVGGY